jgi:16S rRNA (guanine966-N2)-methyltransferase
MRVIGGEFRSRRLKSLPGLATRPTPDRLRETLFDILGSTIENKVFLDAYAGTGAVGIEALSRGAARAIFIERRKAIANVISENLASLGAADRAVVVAARALAAIARYKAHIVFLDPPYDLESEYSQALEILSQDAPDVVIAQHSVRLALAEKYSALQHTRDVRQGDNVLSWYSAKKS